MAFTAIVMVFSPPEYCKLFAQKETYQGDVVTGTPGTPPLPSPSYALRVLVLKSGIRILENRLLHPPLRISMSTPFPPPREYAAIATLHCGVNTTDVEGFWCKNNNLRVSSTNERSTIVPLYSFSRSKASAVK